MNVNIDKQLMQDIINEIALDFKEHIAEQNPHVSKKDVDSQYEHFIKEVIEGNQERFLKFSFSSGFEGFFKGLQEALHEKMKEENPNFEKNMH